MTSSTVGNRVDFRVFCHWFRRPWNIYTVNFTYPERRKRAITGNSDLLVIDDVGNHTLTGGLTINCHLFFNAKIGGLVGNGVADDTVALQTLIDTAASNRTRSATIYFPPELT